MRNDQSWQADTLVINRIRIHYYRTGGELPPVVLSHGAMDDGLCWTRVAAALEGDYDVIMPDARGHGFSGDGAGDYSTGARAADLLGLIEALNLDRPVLGGHSMGGTASLHAAVNRPDLIRGFFMEDPSMTCPGEPLFGRETGKVTEVMITGLLRLWKLFKYLPRSFSYRMAKRLLMDAPPEDIEPWLDSKGRVSGDFITALEEPAWLVEHFEDHLLGNVKSPAMLIYGDREKGAIVSHQLAEAMKKRVDGLQVVHLAGASHDIRRIRFDGYLSAVQAFLQEVMGQ